jgi:D-xylose transport system permease protein
MLTHTALIVALAVTSVEILGRFLGVPTAGVILFGLVALLAFAATRTRFGLYVFAAGGNAEAAPRAASRSQASAS